MTTLKAILPLHEEQLCKARIATPALVITLLWAHLLDIPPEELPSHLDAEVDQHLDKASVLLHRVLAHEPIDRILGKTLYNGLTFRINEAVFRPMPTETTPLLDLATTLLEDNKDKPLRILDLGTGCGFLLLNLLKAFPRATGVGTDINEQICALARQNARDNGLGQRAIFRVHNWTRGINERFDVVIANPPAVPTANIPVLPLERVRFDPLAALDGGNDGAACFRAIAKGLHNVLASDGVAIFKAYTQTQEANPFFRRGFNVDVVSDHLQVPYALIVTPQPTLWTRTKKAISRFVRKLRTGKRCDPS